MGALHKSGLQVQSQMKKDFQISESLTGNHQIDAGPAPQSSLSLNLQQLKIKMNQASEPHLTESYTFTQIVNKSIQSLQSRKQLAEDTMNILTEIIELRSSC